MNKFLIADYLSQGVKLSLVDDNVRYKMRSGIAVSDILPRVKADKSQILSLLQTDEYWMPVSSAQEDLYLFQYMNRGDSSYNISLSITLNQDTSVKQCEECIGQLMSRHRSLRRVYALRDEKVYQAALACSVGIDHRSYVDGQRAEYDADRYEFSQVPFALDGSPLLRCLLQTANFEGETECAITMSIHHLNGDFWSLGIMLNDLNLVLSGRGLAAKPSAEDRFIETVSERHLHGASPYDIDAFTECYRPYWLPEIQTCADNDEGINQLAFAFGSDMKDALRQCAKLFGVTEFVLVASSLYCFLQKITGKSSLTICSPTFGRSIEDCNTVGYYVQPIAMFVDVSKSAKCSDFFQAVKRAFISAMDASHIPLSRFAREIRQHYPDVLGKELPVFFNWNAMPEMSGGESCFESVKVSQVGGFCELMLTLTETGEGYSGAWHYKSKYNGFVRGWHKFFECLLREISSGNNIALDLLPTIGPYDVEVIRGINSTETKYDDSLTVLDHIRIAAANHGDRAAVVFNEKRLTYTELEAVTSVLASRLAEEGVGSENFVGVCAHRSLELVVSLLAIMKAGSAYVPLDPSFPQKRIADLLEDSNISCVLTAGDTAFLGAFEQLKTILVDVSECETSGVAYVNESAPDLAAYMLFTSGSTGKPKGVVVSHKALNNRLMWMQGEYQLRPEYKVLQKTPFSFDVSIWEFFWPLMCGATLVVAKPDGHKDPEYLLDVIDREGITHLHFVPSMLQIFLSFCSSGQMKSIKHMYCSGEELTPSLVREFFKKICGARLHNLYGPTEAAIDVTYFECEEAHGNLSSIPIGRPVANTQIHILDENLKPLPIGAVGEIYIGGVQLAKCYHNRPALNAERFLTKKIYPGDSNEQRIYRTGDLARWNPNGEIEYLGRNDNQVKIRGQRVELGEVDSAIASLPYVSYSICLVHKSNGNPILIAFYVARDSGAAGSGDIVDRLRADLVSLLPLHMIPVDYVPLAEIPTTTNGKLDKPRLIELYESRKRRFPTAEPSPQGLNKDVCSAWSAVLGESAPSGPNENFFLIGGDSIKAIKFLSELQKRGIHLPADRLYKYPTLSGLSLLVDEAADDPECPEAINEQPVGRFELLERMVDNLDQADVQDAYPLTSLQEIMFTQSSLHGGVLYHDVFTVHSVGAINHEELIDVVSRVNQMHEVLRTRISIGGSGDLYQIVEKSAAPTVTKIEVNRSADFRFHVYIAAEREKINTFSCDKENLIRYVHVTNGEKSALILSFHHLILDGWSVASLISQVFGMLSHVEPSSDRPIYRFADYVKIEGESVSNEKSRSYWKRYLASARPALVGSSRYGESFRADDISEIRIPISAIQSELLLEKSRDLGVSLKVLCLAAHGIILSRVLGRPNPVTGYVSNGRLEHGGYENVLGLHLNTLPIIVPSVDVSVRDFVNLVGNDEAQAIEHRRYPLYNLLRDLGEVNLFDSVFNFTNFHVYQSGGLGNAIEDIEYHEFTDFNFVSSFSVDPRDDQVKLKFVFNRKRLADDVALSVAEAYAGVIDSLISIDANAAVSELLPDLSPPDTVVALLNGHEMIKCAGGPECSADGSQHYNVVPVDCYLPQVESFKSLPKHAVHTLANDMDVCMINRSETDFIYQEIFEDGFLENYDLVLPESPVVFDVGANIGLFTMYVYNLFPSATFYPYEPVPQVYSVMQKNVSTYKINCHFANMGLSNRCGSSQFSYYEGNTLISGQYATEADIDLSALSLINSSGDKSISSASLVADYLKEKMAATALDVSLTTLSDEIRKHDLDRIHLLKIDVEKAELDVLQGLSESHWTLIDNLFVEVHDVNDRLETIENSCRSHGFEVVCYQDEKLKGTNVYSLIASRHPITKRVTKRALPWRFSKKAFVDDVLAALPASVGKGLGPQSINVVDALHHSGTVPVSSGGRGAGGAYRAESDSDCNNVLKVWSDVLARPVMDGNVSFYDAGGDSISLLKVVRKLNVQYGFRIPVSAIRIDHTASEMVRLGVSAQVRPALIDTVSQVEGALKKLLFVVPFATPMHIYDPIIGSLQGRFSVERLNVSDELLEAQSLSEAAVEVVNEIGDRVDSDYVIAGWSLGGNLAAAISEKLNVKKGINLPLVLIDSHFPGTTLNEYLLEDFQSLLAHYGEDPYFSRRVELIRGYCPAGKIEHGLYFSADKGHGRRDEVNMDFIESVTIRSVPLGHFEIVEDGAHVKKMAEMIASFVTENLMETMVANDE